MPKTQWCTWIQQTEKKTAEDNETFKSQVSQYIIHHSCRAVFKAKVDQHNIKKVVTKMVRKYNGYKIILTFNLNKDGIWLDYFVTDAQSAVILTCICSLNIFKAKTR